MQNESWIQNFFENFKERDIFGDMGVDANIKFKYYH
jgi:hypothetical protein